MTTRVSPASAGNINKLTISSNRGGGSADISAIVPEFNYYESVLSNVITASMVVAETGFESSGCLLYTSPSPRDED